MEDKTTELNSLLEKFDKAKLPTTKADIGAQVIKILVPMAISQGAEIAALKNEGCSCQK